MRNTYAYNKENYHTITVRIPKDKKDILQALAKKERRSINQLITIAIEEYYKVDLSSTTEDSE